MNTKTFALICLSFFALPSAFSQIGEKKTAFNWPENIQTPNQEVVLVEDMKDASYKVLGSIACKMPCQRQCILEARVARFFFDYF